jgi:DnaJ homolog subfamily A member 5
MPFRCLQVRRAMEQENEKHRKNARKEYNEGVRELVTFLRKRDKRVAARQVEEAKRKEERMAAEAARCVSFFLRCFLLI